MLFNNVWQPDFDKPDNVNWTFLVNMIDVKYQQMDKWNYQEKLSRMIENALFLIKNHCKTLQNLLIIPTSKDAWTNIFFRFLK